MTDTVVLHLKVPSDNDKGPLAMESVFNGLGELFRSEQTALAFEIAVRSGFLYFFVACDRQDVDLVRGQLYAQYPHLALEEVVDYTDALSSTPISITVRLERSDAYPLKTYKELDADFLTNLSGIATSVGKDDLLGMQIIVQPVDTKSANYKAKEFFRSLWRGTLRKSSPHLFRTTIRVAAAAGTKSEVLVTSFASLLQLLDNPNLNSLKIWKKTQGQTAAAVYKQRGFAQKTFDLSSDELAHSTIFHIVVPPSPKWLCQKQKPPSHQ